MRLQAAGLIKHKHSTSSDVYKEGMEQGEPAIEDTKEFQVPRR